MVMAKMQTNLEMRFEIASNIERGKRTFEQLKCFV